VEYVPRDLRCIQVEFIGVLVQVCPVESEGIHAVRQDDPVVGPRRLLPGSAQQQAADKALAKASEDLLAEARRDAGERGDQLARDALLRRMHTQAEVEDPALADRFGRRGEEDRSLLVEREGEVVLEQ